MISALERDVLETASALATPDDSWTPTRAYRGAPDELGRAVADRHGHHWYAATLTVERLISRALLRRTAAGRHYRAGLQITDTAARALRRQP